MRKPNVNLVKEMETQAQFKTTDGKIKEPVATNKLGGKDTVLGSASSVAGAIDSSDGLNIAKEENYHYQ